MQPVSPLSHPQTQKCLHTVAKKWEHNESHAKWQRRRGKRWALVGKKRTAKTGKGEVTVGEEEEAGHSEMVDWKKGNKGKEGNKNKLRNGEKVMWEQNKFDYVRRGKEMRGLEHFLIFFLEYEEVRIIKEWVKPNNWEGEGEETKEMKFSVVRPLGFDGTKLCTPTSRWPVHQHSDFSIRSGAKRRKAANTRLPSSPTLLLLLGSRPEFLRVSLPHSKTHLEIKPQICVNFIFFYTSVSSFLSQLLWVMKLGSWGKLHVAKQIWPPF